MCLQINTNKVIVCPFSGWKWAELLKNKALWEAPEVTNKVTLLKIYSGNCYENVNILHSLSHIGERHEHEDRDGILKRHVYLKPILNRFPLVCSEFLPNTSALSLKSNDLENIQMYPCTQRFSSILHIVLSCAVMCCGVMWSTVPAEDVRLSF